MSGAVAARPRGWLRGVRGRFKNPPDRSTAAASMRPSPSNAELRRKAQRGEDVLGHLQTTCKVLSAVAQGSNIPAVGTVVGAVSWLIATAQTVQTNRIECLELAEELADRLVILEDCKDCAQEDIPEHTAVVFQQLHDVILDLGQAMRAQVPRSWFSRSLSSGGDKKRIAECKIKLDNATDKFIIAVHLLQARYQQRVERQMRAIQNELSVMNHTHGKALGINARLAAANLILAVTVVLFD